MQPKLVMQIARFSDGGFVLHKLTIHCSSMHFSAWFDKAGKIIDVEGFDRMGRNRPIKKDGPCWKEIARKGKYYHQVLSVSTISKKVLKA